MVEQEWRVGACRFEFTFVGRAAERRRGMLEKGPHVRATDKSLVHTWMDTNQAVHSVTYLTRNGTLPLG